MPINYEFVKKFSPIIKIQEFDALKFLFDGIHKYNSENDKGYYIETSIVYQNEDYPNLVCGYFITFFDAETKELIEPPNSIKKGVPRILFTNYLLHLSRMKDVEALHIFFETGKRVYASKGVVKDNFWTLEYLDFKEIE